MKDKEERKLQFVLRYYEDGKLDTKKALKKITGIAHQNKVSGFWACFSGIAATILICVVSYTLLSRKEHHTVSITADAIYCVNYGRCDGDKIFSARQYAGYTFPRGDFGI